MQQPQQQLRHALHLRQHGQHPHAEATRHDGKPDTAAHTPATYADIDDLTFDYDGNQILKVTDAVDDGPYYQGAWHYSDNADAQQERFYDGNGNLVKDLDAKISDIQYNSLNLPIMITFTDGSTTRYTYDVTGRKLRTEHRVMTTGVFNPGQELLNDAGVLDDPGVEMPAPDFPGLNAPAAVMMPQEMEQAAPPAISDAEEASGSPKRPRSTGDAPAEYLPYELTVTDYCGNFIYENGKLSRILFDGGYITFPDTMVNEVTIANINKPQYHFYFTDHLGNIRVVTDANGNVEQVNNYYPYGGLMASSSSIATPSSSYPANQPYRYNGKELDRKNGLDWMDYGARHFAGHGQWTSPDPLAEKYYDRSPYVYCNNNPILYLDPNGKWGLKYVNHENKTITISAVFVMQTEPSAYRDQLGIIAFQEQFSINDVSYMQERVNKELNSLGLTINEGKHEGYSLIFDFIFVAGGDKLNSSNYAKSFIKDNHRYGNLLFKGNSRNYKGFAGNADGSFVGAITDKQEGEILMNEEGDTYMNRVHELFHLLGLTHPKRQGASHGIMHYPPLQVDQQDANDLDKSNQYLYEIEE